MVDDVVELGPENDEQCVRLRRALRAVDGFQLILVEVEAGPVRTELLRRIATWCERGEVAPLTTVRVSHERSDPVGQLTRPGRGVVALGLDAPHGTEADRRRLVRRTLQALNWGRDQLAQQIPGPLVMMMGHRGLQLMFEVAPDLAAWRKLSLRVTSPPPTTPPAPRPWTIDLAREYAATRDLPTTLANPSRAIRVWLPPVARAVRVRGWLQRFDEAEHLLHLLRVREHAIDFAWLDIAAAEIALDQHAPDRARTALERATRALDAADHADGLRLALALAQGRAAQGDPDGIATAWVAFSTAARLAPQLQDRTSEVVATVGLAVTARLGEDRTSADEYLARAAALPDGAEGSWLRFYIATVSAWCADPPEALAHLDQAYALAAENGGPEIAEVAVNAAAVALAAGESAECERWLARAWPATSDAAPVPLRAAYWRVQGMRALRRDPRAALTGFRKAQQLDGFGGSCAEAQLLAEAGLGAGEFAEAVDAFARAREIAEARGDRSAVALADLGIGRAMLAGADVPLEDGVRRLRSAITTFMERQQPAREALARVALGDALARTPDRRDATAEYQRAGDIFDAIGESAGRDLARRKAADIAALDASQGTSSAGV